MTQPSCSERDVSVLEWRLQNPYDAVSEIILLFYTEKFNVFSINEKLFFEQIVVNVQSHDYTSNICKDYQKPFLLYWQGTQSSNGFF